LHNKRKANHGDTLRPRCGSRRIVGLPGTIRIHDLELLVDGIPLSEVPRIDTLADRKRIDPVARGVERLDLLGRTARARAKASHAT
jgi:hypothetical protein